MRRLGQYLFLGLCYSGLINAQTTIEITDIERKEGTVYACLYSDEESFMEDGGHIECHRRNVDSSTMILFFDSEITVGAFTVFQDLNENGSFDTNFIGIPNEPYGFSNNPTIRFGPPTYEEAKVDFTKTTSIEITLR